MHCVALRKHNTTSAFVIVEMTNNKHYSTLFKTRVWIVISKFFKYQTYLEVVSQKHQTILATLELPHFIVFTAIQSVHIVGYSLPGSENSSSFAFTMKHSVSRTWRQQQQQYHSENNSSSSFLCVNEPF